MSTVLALPNFASLMILNASIEHMFIPTHIRSFELNMRKMIYLPAKIVAVCALLVGDHWSALLYFKLFERLIDSGRNAT